MYIAPVAYLLSALMLFGLASPASGEGLHLLYDEALTLCAHQPELFGSSPGLLVASLERKSPARPLGIRVGDLWIAYRGAPIESLDAFLAARSQPGSEGRLNFLRGGHSESLTLSAGKLGVGLVELVQHGLSEGDADVFFELLQAGYAGDRERVTGLIRGNRSRFERILQHFAELSTENQRGAAQLQRWQQSIATFVGLDDRLRQLEGAKASLEAKRAGVERQLEAVREARLLKEIAALERRGQSHTAERNYDRAVADALKAVELARSLPVPRDPARRPAAQAMALAQEGSLDAGGDRLFRSRGAAAGHHNGANRATAGQVRGRARSSSQRSARCRDRSADPPDG